MNDFICVKLKEIVDLQDITKIDEIYYSWKCRKAYGFSEYSLPIVF